MKKQFTILLIQLFILSTSCAQQKLYDEEKVTMETELNLAFSKNKGIANKNIVYFIEDDNQTLSAYENGKLKWQTNIIKVCGKPKVGEPKIRHIKLRDKVIDVTYGKHSWAEVDVKSGKAEFIGSD